ncbi:YfhO family protein, partial [Candidatus Roizmanbacteria bacterium]|nr:YfhO family protein [Candidatus Roizmanbacteria bacterium]
YIGIIPLLLATIAILGRRDKKTLFFGLLGLLSLIFALPNFISFLPYQLMIPFLSTTAPSRLIFVMDFSLAVLAALGLDFVLKQKKVKYVFWSGFILLMLYLILWAIISTNTPLTLNLFESDKVNLLVAKRNLYLPTGLFMAGWILIIFLSRLSGKSTEGGRIQNRFWTSQNDVVSSVLVLILLLLTSFDLLRFSQKFNPFVKPDWIFPQTKTISFLQNQPKPFRMENLDDRIMPPNFSGVYGLETIEGYDPLIDKRYAQFMAAVLRNKPDISSFNFNRIITPKLSDNPFINLLNVKYFLSLSDLNSTGITKIFQEGQTRVYENLKVQPRVFLVNNLVRVNSKQEAISQMFLHKNDLDKTAVVEANITLSVSNNVLSKAVIKSYSSQQISVETETNNPSFLVLSQSFLPGWKAKVDGLKTPIYHTDYVLGGVVVPAGKHNVAFYYQPLMFLIGLANFGLGVIILLIWGIKVWLKKRLV